MIQSKSALITQCFRCRKISTVHRWFGADIFHVLWKNADYLRDFNPGNFFCLITHDCIYFLQTEMKIKNSTPSVFLLDFRPRYFQDSSGYLSGLSRNATRILQDLGWLPKKSRMPKLKKVAATQVRTKRRSTRLSQLEVQVDCVASRQ